METKTDSIKQLGDRKNGLMKAVISCFILLAFLILVNSCGSKSKNSVYICTGPAARCYHKTSDCHGLNNCSSVIKKIDIDDAKESGYRACKICY